MKKLMIAVTAAALASLAASAAAQTYSIGTNPQGSLFYASGTAIAKVMVEKTGLQFRVQPYAGSSTYIPLINAGRLAFGLANGAEAAFAYKGIELFKRANPNIRQVAEIFGSDSGYMVPIDSPIKTIADLKGKEVPVGYTSGRIFHFLASAALATAGLTEADLNGVPTPNFVTGAKLLMAGRVDAAYFPLKAGITKQANATIKGGLRFLSTGCSAKSEAAIRSALVPSKEGRVRPARNNTGVVEDPTCFVNVPFTVIAGAHVPADIVYKLVMTMHANKAELVTALGAFRSWNPKDMALPHPNPYHPGAIKAYKELGIWKGK